MKNPFIKYELALAVVEDASRSKGKHDNCLDNLLTPEGLGVSEETFHTLEVSAVRSHIKTFRVLQVSAVRSHIKTFRVLQVIAVRSHIKTFRVLQVSAVHLHI